MKKYISFVSKYLAKKAGDKICWVNTQSDYTVKELEVSKILLYIINLFLIKKKKIYYLKNILREKFLKVDCSFSESLSVFSKQLKKKKLINFTGLTHLNKKIIMIVGKF